MSHRADIPPLEILARYIAGYFPLYDLEGRFYWERIHVRAILPVTPKTVARAEKLAKRSRARFIIRYNTALPEIITHLSDPRIKIHTWVRPEVIRIYHHLHDVGLLQTIEAWHANATNTLAGALVGIRLPGTYIAETMFSLVPDASKICLCQLMQDASRAGHQMIDVQTPHSLDEFARPRDPSKTPHPCIRLGEEEISLASFLRRLRSAWRDTFPGDLNEWLDAATTLTFAHRNPTKPLLTHHHLPAAHLQAARPFFQND